MEYKDTWIRKERFGKVRYMCGACRKNVKVEEDQLKRMIYCPYCGAKKKGIKQ